MERDRPPPEMRGRARAGSPRRVPGVQYGQTTASFLKHLRRRSSWRSASSQTRATANAMPSACMTSGRRAPLVPLAWATTRAAMFAAQPQ
jgi:hypothetical protein